MNEQEKQATVLQLSELAKQAELKEPINWDNFDFSKDEIFNKMSEKVIEQISSIPEEQRLIVSMATMAKLLVENVVLTAQKNKINGDKQ